MNDSQSAGGFTREAFEHVIEISPFTKHVGTSLVSFEPGEVAIRMPIRAEFRQHHGFVHGAVVGYLADTACSWAAASLVGDVVTSEYKINLLAPAVGDVLEATGSVIKAGKRQVVVRADVFMFQGSSRKICATALATIARV